MALRIVSPFFPANQPVPYGLLLVATACLGAGFGLTVPAINALTAAFHPDRVDASVLVLNALLGLGTVLAPVFVAIFVGLGFWWGYGIAAFGTGPLLDAGVSLHVLFGFAAIAAVIMGGLSFTLARKSPAKIVTPVPAS